jgi:phosphate transport system permease protein
MATDETTTDRLGRNTGLRFAQLKGQLFEGLLLVATLVGLVAVLILIGYTAFDAFRPLSASARWYLLYFATLVAPTSAFTLYARRNPAVREANAKAYIAVFGGLAVSLVTYVVADSVSPYDILIYLVFGSLLPILVYSYGRLTDNWTYAGPAIPAALVAGLAAAAGLYPFIRPFVGILASWIVYIGIATVPTAALVSLVATRRWSRRHGSLAAAGILGGTLAVAAASLGTGRNPSLWVVLFSMWIAPVGYVLGETVVRNEAGRVGILGPFVLLGGILVGAGLERQLGIQGLESYLTPTLLVNFWDGLTASNAGVYPQLVGSIIIVGFMSVLAFPVGIGAAVYLEEYAPNTGWRGRFATLIEVNISNLAGVPSVVYGLLGLALFRNTFGFGTGIVISAAGTLGLLILPIVVVSTQEALRSVPDSLRDASYGMGASRWQTLRNVVFPEAIPGTLTGIILAVARAIGETAPLVIIAVATTTYSPPDGLFGSATALPLQIFAARSNVDPAFRHGILPAAAIVLLVLMLVMNATAIIIRNRYDR